MKLSKVIKTIETLMGVHPPEKVFSMVSEQTGLSEKILQYAHQTGLLVEYVKTDKKTNPDFY